MFKNSTLRILMTVVFCFLQVVEINANLWRGNFQEDIFIAMVAQEKDIFVQATNQAFISVSGQNTSRRDGSIIGPKAEKTIFIAISLFLGKIAFKTFEVLKKRAADALFRAFENWRDSLYH
ncbi:hypothetical protein [Bartonella phoceensis]|uniref:hypothetical protein n=1 Tax=Bartonella phoceensis TaxID=270249 RepID=UPI001ABA4303|nr:hypothetical protein [Bartonella phoceensis]